MILFNDQILPKEEVHINFEDRGYQFGDGVYEVVNIYNGKPFLLDEHFVRFERSLNEIKISLSVPIKEIKTKIVELINVNNVYNGIVYFQASRGVSPRQHQFPINSDSVLIGYTSEKKRNINKILKGIKVVSTKDIRWLRCDIKSLNLLGNLLAKQYAIENQADEAIQIRDNIITEGSSSNFFIVKNAKLYTHPANNFILKGITRDLVEKIANDLGIPFIEQELTLNEVLSADEAFITSTSIEITPVLQFDDKIISKKSGPVTKVLQEEYFKHIV